MGRWTIRRPFFYTGGTHDFIIYAVTQSLSARNKSKKSPAPVDVVNSVNKTLFKGWLSAWHPPGITGLGFAVCGDKACCHAFRQPVFEHA
jgi:hypothetical protein